MALLRYHRQFVTVASVLITLLAEPLLSIPTHAACRVCQTLWLRRPLKVMLGLSLPSLSLMRGGNQAVVSLAQGIHTSHRARTALPRLSIVASTPQIHNFLPVRNGWTMARTPDR